MSKRNPRKGRPSKSAVKSDNFNSSRTTSPKPNKLSHVPLPPSRPQTPPAPEFPSQSYSLSSGSETESDEEDKSYMERVRLTRITHTAFFMNCMNCKALFNDNNLPMVMRCGHTMCKNCCDNLQKCSKCNVVIDLKEPYCLMHNKDLMQNLNLYLQACERLPEYELEGAFVDKSARAITTEIDQAYANNEKYISLITKEQEMNRIQVESIKNGFTCSEYIFQFLRNMRNQLSSATSELEFCEKAEQIKLFISQIKLLQEQLDSITLQAFSYDYPNESTMRMALRLRDLRFDKMALRNLFIVQMNCYAVKTEDSKPPKYYRISNLSHKDHFAVESLPDDDQTIASLGVLVIDYKKLRANYKFSGLFVFIQFGSFKPYLLDMFMDDPVLTERVSLLFTGDRGVTYRKGAAYATEKHIFIKDTQGKVKMGLDSFLPMTSDFGECKAPVYGTVWLNWMGESGMEIVVNRVDEDECRHCIGQLGKGGNILDLIPTGDYEIERCGFLMRLPENDGNEGTAPAETQLLPSPSAPPPSSAKPQQKSKKKAKASNK